MNKYSCQMAVWWVHWCSARTRCSCHRNSGGSSSPCPGNGSSTDTLSWLHSWVMKQIIICIRIHVRPHLSWHALVSLVTMYPTRLTSARGQADSWNTSHGCWAAQWPATPSSKATIKHVAGDVISSLCDFLLILSPIIITWNSSRRIHLWPMTVAKIIMFANYLYLYTFILLILNCEAQARVRQG